MGNDFNFKTFSNQENDKLTLELTEEANLKGKTQVLRWQVAFALLLIVAVAVSLIMGLLYYYKDGNAVTVTPQPSQPPPQPTGEYQYAKAAVAADAGECSEIGRDMLAKGGTAVDAAIAAYLCIGLYNYQSTGIGGGFIMLYYNAKTRTTEVLDAKEKAPLAAFETMYEHETEDASITGGLAIAVPGQLAGYWTAHQRYGMLPWSDLFQPSIKLAEEGIVVSRELAHIIKKREIYMKNDPSLGEIFLNSKGEILKEGDTLVDTKLADTYKKLAEGGENAFYKGDLADDIVADIADRGGIITKADLESYQVRRREPLMFELDGMKVYSPPPPGSGAVYALIMNILEGYGIGPDSIATTEAETLTTHRMIEAFKFAYAGRSLLGDEDYVDVKEIIANMTSQSYADALRAAIDDNQTNDPSYYTAYYYQPDGGTSHLSIVDTHGNAVSATSSINLYFGSKVRGNRTGILFNDAMDDFSKPGVPNSFCLPPSVSNFIRPGKRPMSSMTPTIMVDHDGKIKLVVGASGATHITTGVAQVTVDTLWYGDSIKNAIQRRRFHHQLFPNNVTYEAGFNQDVIDGLSAKGHYSNETKRVCVVQGIMRDAQGFWSAYCDNRKGGYPAGI
ncbi:gamma-glutamyltranspeptidase 1-like isoform X2 [Acanthaster planci]|uniref:Gamma-glutamyltranspeptidase 1-like isoform X2 n=1 Tax=Acanthaster planci TaxID=133434 RepID=A0A8B7ZUX1_ACAPL|nr:gamma-glutamyltranspeptidase 1-like isoform X2 [Acanthaster planci]